MATPGDVLSTRHQRAVQTGVHSVNSNMAGVLFEDIFNVKDIDPEGKKFDRGKSTSEFTFRFVRASTCRGDARAIFIVRMLASRELVDLALPARRAHGATSTWLLSYYSSGFLVHKEIKILRLQYRETSHRGF